jgi:hypothetical protein
MVIHRYGNAGHLPRERRKDGLPIDGRDFRARNGSCNRDAEHTVARGDIEHLARGPARQLGCDILFIDAVLAYQQTAAIKAAATGTLNETIARSRRR